MHILKTRLLSLFRNKTIIFWSLVFPIILSVFFNLAFANIESHDMFETIQIGMIEDEDFDEVFFEFFKSFELESGEKMFAIQLAEETQLGEMLNNAEIIGIVDRTPAGVTLKVSSSGFQQTILKSVLDGYIQTESVILDLIVLSESNPEQIVNDLMNTKTYLNQETINRNRANLVLTYFFALLGMALIYGGLWGTDNILNLQPNMTAKGVRVAVSPVNRMKILLLYTLAAFIVHIMVVIILLFHFLVVLGLDFGGNLPLIFLVSVLGSLVGITFGSFIAVALKKAKEGIKIMITTLVGVLGGFLSGMMMVEMKYYIQVHAPIISYINPVSVITDAFYTLNYFGPNSRFYLNLGILGLMIIVFTLGTYLFYRRDSYESI